MSMKSDDALTKRIRKEYPKYLDKLEIQYNNRDGFYVRIKLNNICTSFTQVGEGLDGKVLITDYCGTCYSGIRIANRIAKAIQAKYPMVDIRVERYGTFEIDIYHEIPFTTIEELHRNVILVAETVDAGVVIGKQMLGDEFVR